MDPVLRKLDSAAREALEQAVAGQCLQVLVKVSDAGEGLKARLEQVGLDVHSLSGPIATGAIDVQKLTELAALPFVRRVELSRSLHAER